MQQIIPEPRNNGTWLVNYDAWSTVQNYHFLRQFHACRIAVPRIWRSRDCAAIVVSMIPLEDISEPHVMAWRNSFYEISLQVLLDEVAWETIPATRIEA